MIKASRCILIAVSTMVFTGNSFGQWTRICQPGADIFSLALSGSTVVGVGSQGRVFSSTDSGVTWSASPKYVRRFPVLYKASMLYGTTLFGAGSGEVIIGGGMYAIIVGGDDILAFAESRSPTNSTLLAGGFGGGIRISSDRGLHWTPSNAGLSNLNITSLASGPTLADDSGQMVFAGTYGSGVFATTDNGLTWASKSEGLPCSLINAIEIDGSRLYVAGNEGKVCSSSDWGESWHEIGMGLPRTELLTLEITTEGSTEWLFVGSIDAGIWRCPVAGGAWSPCNTGLRNLRINSILSTGASLLVGTHEGIYRSVDTGSLWTQVVDGAAPRLITIHALPPFSPDGKDVIVSGTRAVYFSGVYPYMSKAFASDFDAAFFRSSNAMFNGSVLSIAHRNDLIFLLAGGTGDCGASTGMMVSSNLGATWENRSGYYQGTIRCGAMFACLEIVPAKDGTRLDCYQGSPYGPSPGLFFSSDTGRTWTNTSTKGPKAIGTVDSFLVFADYQGVYRSSDHGVTLTNITASLSGNCVTAFVDDGDRLLACITSCDPTNPEPRGLLITTDAGQSWTSAGLVGTTVSSLLPTTSCLLAVADGRVYASFRETLQWVDVTGNLAGTAMGKVTATPQFCYLLGADGKSIWKRPMAEILVALETPVPIQLAGFTGTLVNSAVHLAWSTLSEVNNYGFYIQRKLASDVAWTDLPNGFVAGHGTTTEPQHYAFTDASPLAGPVHYRLKQVDMDGTVHFSEPIQVDVATPVDEQVPSTFALHQNHPNPFNPSTSIGFRVSGLGSKWVKLGVYDLLGREVAVLVNELKAPGSYEVKWDGGGLPSGVYICRMTAGSFAECRKMLLMK